MSAKSAFSVVGLVHKVCLAAEEQGYTPELLNTLAEHPTLFRNMLQVQLGYAEVKALEHIINCDADPFVPAGWSVEEHQKGGSFKWNSAEVQFYLSKLQKQGKVIKGDELRKELAGKPVLNANVLDYLLAHPHLIPEAWKKDERGFTRYIFFWGTIYRNSGGSLFVRYLGWGGDRWRWDCRWLGCGWSDDDPAALRA
jgi:hypothetical protein